MCGGEVEGGGSQRREQTVTNQYSQIPLLKKKKKIKNYVNPQSQKLLIPSGFDGLLQIGLVIYGTRSKDSTCADFEWHAGRASTEQGAGTRGIFREAFGFTLALILALAKFTYWNPGTR